MTDRNHTKAFVSSTFKDLEHHRRHVIGQLRASGIYIDPMEDWTADHSSPKALSKERVVDCDLCVLLLARRRGHIPQGEVRSVTQLEYQQAVDLGIHVLAFLLDDAAEWNSQYDERPSDPAVVQWRSELCETHFVEFFQEEPNSVAVLPAVLRWFQDRPGVNSKRLAALNSVREVTRNVRGAVAHDHNFRNRLDWAREMEKLGDRYRELISDLYIPIQQISWRIRDHSFDHEQSDSQEYCCNELVRDLRALELEVLTIIQNAIKPADAEDLAVEILSDIELMKMGVGRFVVGVPVRPEGVSKDSEEFRRYLETLRESEAENQRWRDKERARHLAAWRAGIDWDKSYAVAANQETRTYLKIA